ICTQMNKPPQPIAGPPHPSPSPGLSQASYPPGQPPSMVFASPPPPQMNPAPQPRQGGFRSLQPYYANRSGLPPGPRGGSPGSGPRAVAPTHVYQAGPGSQMMMIPQPQLSFPSSPQGTAYFIPGQYRSAYLTAPQQYPVQTGKPGFYPSSTPEYGPYAGAYYPAPAQLAAPVQAAPHIATKRERKPVWSPASPWHPNPGPGVCSAAEPRSGLECRWFGLKPLFTHWRTV
ncbi:hypothetical protein NHX12_000551, partial [Muraenolepis orangiensis]